jgi:hypothetical protein
MADKKKDAQGGKHFDLTSLDTSEAAETGAVLEVLHPTENTPLGIKITLAGADSDIYRKTVNKNVNKRVQRMKPGQSLPFTAEEQEESGLNLLAVCTLAWEGIVVEGDALPCNKENAKMVYQRFPWIKEQVDQFIGDRANFLSK